MVKIKLNLNEMVNPCISTVHGEYTPNYHQIYISCNYLEKELYQKFGWYLGCVFVGSKNLYKVKRKVFSEILSDINKSIDLNIEGNRYELNNKIISLIEKIIIMINEKLDKDIYPIKIQNNMIRRFN